VSVHAGLLNIDPTRIIVAGESGGANLSLAVALNLNRDGYMVLISGIWVSCPYLAGEWKGVAGSSAQENAGILMDTRSNYGAMAYGINELHNRNPLAWPGFMKEYDVAGFPPVWITVNECDPLRDDGINFYRLLLSARVNARCKQVMGTVHATEIYILPCSDISRASQPRNKTTPQNPGVTAFPAPGSNPDDRSIYSSSRAILPSLTCTTMHTGQTLRVPSFMRTTNRCCWT